MNEWNGKIKTNYPVFFKKIINVICVYLRQTFKCIDVDDNMNKQYKIALLKYADTLYLAH